MEVRFRRADGTEFYREVDELRESMCVAEHPFLSAVPTPVSVSHEDPVVMRYDLYDDLEGQPIYVGQGSAHKWLR